MNDTQENGTDSSIPVGLIMYTSDLAFNLILVLPSNIYVLWLQLSGAGGTIASEFFYLNLTASVIISTLASVFNFALFFTYFTNYTLMMVSNFTFLAFVRFSLPSFQCCICVERYIAVVHPVVFLRYKALRYRVACCCVVWLMVLALCLFWFFLEMIYISLGFCIVCISVVSFCCLSVLRALKQPGPGEGQRDSSGKDMKRRAFTIILISLVVMVVTIMSYIPSILYDSLTTERNPVAVIITRVLARVSLVVHPVLYIYKAGKLPCFN